MTYLDNLPKPFFALAPMDDVTDTVFRQIVAGLAPADLYFTEFVNVDGLQSPGRERLIHKLRLDDKTNLVIAQLWGLKPGNFYKTTKELKRMGYRGVDLNFGCPVKAVIKNGACAALINNRSLAGEIINATKEAAGEDFPVSVKTRIGFTTPDLSWIEFLLPKILNMLSIHGRTAKELSSVPARWDIFEDIIKMRNSLSPTTKIVGNGDVINKNQAISLATKYDLDGVMIGRGIFHDPYAFSLKDEWQSKVKRERIELYIKHVKLFQRTWKHNERRVETLNKFCKVYINGFDGAKDLREELMRARSSEELLLVLENIRHPESVIH